MMSSEVAWIAWTDAGVFGGGRMMVFGGTFLVQGRWFWVSCVTFILDCFTPN